jgi:hypothetical protein
MFVLPNVRGKPHATEGRTPARPVQVAVARQLERGVRPQARFQIDFMQEIASL